MEAHHGVNGPDKADTKKIISQIVMISEVCDQNGDRVSKNDKSWHSCCIRLKWVQLNIKNFGTLSIDDSF